MESRVVRLEDGFLNLTNAVQNLEKADAHHTTEIALLRQSVESGTAAQEKIELHLSSINRWLDGARAIVRFIPWLLGAIVTLLTILAILYGLENGDSIKQGVGDLLSPFGISQFSPVDAEYQHRSGVTMQYEAKLGEQ